MQSSRIGDFTIYYENAEEFRVLKREVFSRNDYYIELDAERPLIVDAGANIGDTALYFKRLYPQAKIIAVEPFPRNVALLRRNIVENQLSDVCVVEAALAAKRGGITLYADTSGYDWFTTVSVHEQGWDKQQKTAAITLPAVTLSDLVPSGNIDLLKLDIEGAETQVLPAIQKELPRIRNIIFEYHPVSGRSPEALVRMLERAGYEVEARVEGAVRPNPREVRELSMMTAVRQ